MALLLATLLLAQTSLTPAEAKSHIGEMATVCGKVASARFTVVIFGSDRSKFGEPEKEFLNQTICATGTIEDYRGLPVATETKQIVKVEIRRE